MAPARAAEQAKLRAHPQARRRNGLGEAWDSLRILVARSQDARLAHARRSVSRKTGLVATGRRPAAARTSWLRFRREPNLATGSIAEVEDSEATRAADAWRDFRSLLRHFSRTGNSGRATNQGGVGSNPAGSAKLSMTQSRTLRLTFFLLRNSF